MSVRRVVKLGLMALLAAAGACRDDEQSGGTPITFGAAISRTGASAVPTWGNAFELAAADANAGLRMAGNAARIEFKWAIGDSMTQPAVAVQKANEMKAEHNIKMVLNGTSGDSLALNALNYDPDPGKRLNIPVVCVACSSPSHHNPSATDANPANQAAFRNLDGWHFGLSMSASPQSTVLARIITSTGQNGDVNGDGKLKVSLYNIEDPFGTGFAAVLKQAITRLRSDAIFEQLSHPPRNELLNDLARWTEDMRLLADERTGDVVDGHPDVIIEVTFPQYSLALLKAYDRGNYQVPFLHTHSMREKTVLIQAGDALDGQEGTSYLPVDGVSGQLFAQHFQSQVGISRQSQWDAHVYDGYIIAALGTLVAARDVSDPGAITGAQIRDGMRRVNDPAGTVVRPGPAEFAKAAALIADGKPINYEGASGPCDFDAYGRALNRIAHWKVESGNARDIAVYDCVSNPAECPPQAASN